MTARRQLIIGLDAAEWTLVRRWSEEGRLPTFRDLLARGTHGTLATTAEQLPDTVWSCIYGGGNPATFEKYFYVQYDASTGDLRHVHDDAFTKRPFWKVLSDAGRTVGVVDAVKFPCADSLRGFQISNWGAHATKAAKASTPRELLPEIERRFGPHPVGDCDVVDDKPRSQRALLDRILAGVERRGEVVRSLMRERDWEVMFTAFSEPHCVGHHFWHWLDPDHPRYDESDTHGLADGMERVYRAIDGEIGAMLELVDDNTVCMVVSGHGMGPIYHASWNLPEILDLLGYGRGPARQAEPGRKARANPWRILRMVLPGRLQYAIKNALPQSLQDELLFRWYSGRRDWKGVRAFAVPNNDSVGAIRIGVAGRDPDGVVQPGAEYDAVCSDLAAAFHELRDPTTNRPVVREVSLTHQKFAGEFQDHLPDITVLWEQAFAWQAVHSPRFGTLQIRRLDNRSGSHTPRGFFVCSGPDVAEGAELRGHSIYDIAPTIYAAAGIAMPDGLDGKPLPIFGSTVPA